MDKEKKAYCQKCGKEYPIGRKNLGYHTCTKCSTEVQYRQVSIPATSLDWF